MGQIITRLVRKSHYFPETSTLKRKQYIKEKKEQYKVVKVDL